MAARSILSTTTITLLFFLLNNQINAQYLYSPCPRLFTYEAQNETDRWYGKITLVSDVDLLDIWLRLTFDRPSQQLGNWFGQVETSDSKEYHIRKHNFELKANEPQHFRFFLKYNPREPAPKLLSFRLNGKLVCPEETRGSSQLDTGFQDPLSTRYDDNSRDRVNTQFSTQLETVSQVRPGTYSYGGVDINSRDRVNNQLDTNSYDGVETRFSTQSDTDSQNSLSARDKLDTTTPYRFGINYRDKASTHVDNTTRSSASSRDEVSTQLNTTTTDRFGNSSRDRVSVRFDTASRFGTTSYSNDSTTARDRANVQFSTQPSTDSRNRFVTSSGNRSDSNSRDKVNAQPGTSSRDRASAQVNTTSRLGTQDRDSANSRDRVNEQFSAQSSYNSSRLGSTAHDQVSIQAANSSRDRTGTHSRDRVNVQSGTGSRDGLDVEPTTSSRDRVNIQPSTSYRDRAEALSSGSARDRVDVQPSTNYRDRADVQSSSNSRDRVDVEPSTSYRDRVDAQLSNSRNTLITPLGTNFRDEYETTPQNIVTRDSICGTIIPRPRPLIAYGEITHEGEFPWHAALYLAKDTRLTYICGASLVSRNHVITAAHCVVKAKPQASLDPKELIIQLGKYNLKRFSIGFQDRQVSEIIAHPQFSAESYRNDIALLKFATPANITEYVRPVCLWQESTDISSVLNKIGKVVGWGYDETGQISEELMQAKMPVIPKGKCISSYPDFYTRFTSANSYCAGFANGTSPCNGDAGGGMVFPTPDSNPYNPVWQLRGLISILPAFQNQFLCDVTHYAIFTDVAQYLDWITAVVR